MNLVEKISIAIEAANTPTDKAWAALAVTQAHNQITTPDELASLRSLNERLVGALKFYMSQFGQALEAHGIPFGPAQTEADERARAALQEKQCD